MSVRKRTARGRNRRGAGGESGAPRFGEALGASRSFKVQARAHGPFGVAALAHEVHHRLVSTGGRPSDAAPTIRRLVPIRKAVWRDLQIRAARLSASGRSVSPGQLAAILLERGLRALDESEGGRSRAAEAKRSKENPAT